MNKKQTNALAVILGVLSVLAALAAVAYLYRDKIQALLSKFRKDEEDEDAYYDVCAECSAGDCSDCPLADGEEESKDGQEE